MSNFLSLGAVRQGDGSKTGDGSLSYALSYEVNKAELLL